MAECRSGLQRDGALQPDLDMHDLINALDNMALANLLYAAWGCYLWSKGTRFAALVTLTGIGGAIATIAMSTWIASGVA